MSALKKNLSYFTLNAWLTVRTKSTYRAASILKLFVNLFITILYIYLWSAIYSSNEIINGFTLSDMLAYLLIVRVLRNLYPYGMSQSYGEFIKSGRIAILLLQPIRIEMQLLSNAVGNAIYDFCFCSLPSLLLFQFLFPVMKINFTAFPIFFLWIFGSCIFVSLLELSIGTLSYYMQNLWGISVFKNTIISFLSGELLPIRFYPGRLLKLFERLPFASVYYIPVLLYLGETVENINEYFGILWGSNLFLLILYLFFAKRMIRHITVQGG